MQPLFPSVALSDDQLNALTRDLSRVEVTSLEDILSNLFNARINLIALVQRGLDRLTDYELAITTHLALRHCPQETALQCIWALCQRFARSKAICPERWKELFALLADKKRPPKELIEFLQYNGQENMQPVTLTVLQEISLELSQAFIRLLAKCSLTQSSMPCFENDRETLLTPLLADSMRTPNPELLALTTDDGKRDASCKKRTICCLFNVSSDTPVRILSRVEEPLTLRLQGILAYVRLQDSFGIGFLGELFSQLLEHVATADKDSKRLMTDICTVTFAAHWNYSDIAEGHLTATERLTPNLTRPLLGHLLGKASGEYAIAFHNAQKLAIFALVDTLKTAHACLYPDILKAIFTSYNSLISVDVKLETFTYIAAGVSKMADIQQDEFHTKLTYQNMSIKKPKDKQISRESSGKKKRMHEFGSSLASFEDKDPK